MSLDELPCPWAVVIHFHLDLSWLPMRIPIRAVDQVPCNLTIASRIVGEFYSHYSSKHIPILNRSQMIFQLKRKGYLWVPSSNQTWLVDVVDIELRLVKFSSTARLIPGG